MSQDSDITYLKLLCDLMQSQGLKFSQPYKLINIMHDCAFVVIIAPEAFRNDLGDYSAAESRHVRCRTSHVCKARFVTRSLI
jgi:hypothetical protein